MAPGSGSAARFPSSVIFARSAPYLRMMAPLSAARDNDVRGAFSYVVVPSAVLGSLPAAIFKRSASASRTIASRSADRPLAHVDDARAVFAPSLIALWTTERAASSIGSFILVVAVAAELHIVARTSARHLENGSTSSARLEHSSERALARSATVSAPPVIFVVTTTDPRRSGSLTLLIRTNSGSVGVAAPERAATFFLKAIPGRSMSFDALMSCACKGLGVGLDV